ncbi:MAG: MliC family protein [Proteobacteria bacterium]|nr:MliC family protein [Pseudomonadota bacterium]
MNKKISPFLLSFVFSIPLSLNANNNQPKYWSVNSDHVVNIYEQPKYNAKVVGVISPKSYGLKNLGCSLKKTNAWCKIDYREQIGWIEGRYLKEYIQEEKLIANNDFTVNCERIEYNDDKLICHDSHLKMLDEQLNAVFEQAQKVALAEEEQDALDKLKENQKEWVKNRHDCWKSQIGLAECIKQFYEMRITELQAYWKLIPSTTFNHFICDDNTEFFITEYATKPLASATIDYEGNRAVLVQSATANGVKYIGANDSYVWLQGKNAAFAWDLSKPVLHCAIQDLISS